MATAHLASDVTGSVNVSAIAVMKTAAVTVTIAMITVHRKWWWCQTVVVAWARSATGTAEAMWQRLIVATTT